MIKGAGTHQQNALWKYFGIKERARESDPGDPIQAKLDVIMAALQNFQSANAEVANLQRRTTLDPGMLSPKMMVLTFLTPRVGRKAHDVAEYDNGRIQVWLQPDTSADEKRVILDAVKDAFGRREIDMDEWTS